MNPCMRAAMVTVVTMLCTAVPAHAQQGVGIAGGSFGPRVSYDYEYGDSGSGPGRHMWIRSVVLWRGQPEWAGGSQLDSTARRAAERVRHAWRAEVAAAEDSGRMIMGGLMNMILHTAEIDRDGSPLRVLGQRFTVPERDSILVVMIDRIDSVGGPPYIAGATYVKTAPPARFWPKIWERGDTTFIINPHGRNDMLAAELRKSPAIAEFLR